jgi:hypothetical protein
MSDLENRPNEEDTIPEVEVPEPEIDVDAYLEEAPIPDEPILEPEEMEGFNPEKPWLSRPWMLKQMRELGKNRHTLAKELDVPLETISLQVRLFDL